MDGCKCKHRSHRCQEARIKREEAEIKGKVVVSVLGSHGATVRQRRRTAVGLA